MSNPEVWNKPETQKEIKKHNDVKELILNWKRLLENLREQKEMVEIAEEENETSILEEIERELTKLKKEYDRLEKEIYFQNEEDKKNAYLMIHSGAGGTEACDWAEMLLRMYKMWADRRKYKYEIVDIQYGEEAGIRSATMLIKGKYAYGYLKGEAGVHRLVRISPFDANRRRHTSFASVDVIPEVEDDIKVEINEKDLKIETFRASGPGGQHVNVTDSAVRITHIPTGIVVSCQKERSQHQNRATAMKILRARLYQYYKEQKEKELREREKSKMRIEWGSQIRSYVFHPYVMVKDHRTGFETGNGKAVLDGEIDDFINAYIEWSAKKGDIKLL